MAAACSGTGASSDHGTTAPGSSLGGSPGAGGGGVQAQGGGGGTGAGGSTATSGTGGAAPAQCPSVSSGVKSKWVYPDANGKLQYATLPTGERILDFSTAGYQGGGVALPVVPVQQTVMPSGGDDTGPIQAALDAVAKRTPENGLRGAVLLAAGSFTLQGSLTISASGVVLRGSGSGTGGTTIHVTGSPRNVITVGGSGSWQASGTTAHVTDAFVPSGARSFHVDSTAGLSVGAAVLVDRPVTTAWIHFMGMDTLVRNGAPQTWISAGTVIHTDRTIAAIQGSLVTLDAPVSDTLDAKYTSASVTPYTFAGRIEEVGVESIHLVAPQQTVPISQPTFGVLSLDAVKNGWVKDVVAEEFTSGFDVGSTAKWITIEDSRFARTAPIDGSAGYPFAYSVGGQGVLVQRSSFEANEVFSYATQARTPGPNVVLDFSTKGNPSNLQPHQRWATGLLVDNADAPGGSIDLMNRGYYGSGHGWTIGFGVAWNSTAATLLIQQPPGSENWAIGSTGMVTTAGEPGGSSTPLPSGIVDALGTAVAPKSLYLAQLCERLGPSALSNIGY